jgi:hypothetical protein
MPALRGRLSPDYEDKAMAGNKGFNPRTARDPKDGEPQYIVIAGAPASYISGWGLVGPGAIVTLGAGVKPGKYLVEIAASDAAKINADSTGQLALAAAEMARERKAAGKADDDAKRKQAIDDKKDAEPTADKVADPAALAAAQAAADNAKRAGEPNAPAAGAPLSPEKASGKIEEVKDRGNKQ